jgi:hypothetical protein
VVQAMGGMAREDYFLPFAIISLYGSNSLTSFISRGVRIKAFFGQTNIFGSRQL